MFDGVIQERKFHGVGVRFFILFETSATYLINKKQKLNHSRLYNEESRGGAQPQRYVLLCFLLLDGVL